MKRRLNRALKDFRADGKGPMDDIAYAVIRVTPTTKEGEDDDSENTDTSRPA